MIVTEFVNPPVPSRACDWVAYISGDEADGPIGRGPTECDALRDLCEQMLISSLTEKAAS